MTTAYPGAIDAFTNPDAATDDLNTAGVEHDAQHADANDAIEAIETKVGTGASTPATAGHVLTADGAGASSWQALSGGGGGTAGEDRLWTPGAGQTSEDEFTAALSGWTQATPTGTVNWLQGADVLSAKFDSVAASDAAALLKPITITAGGYIETAIRLLARGTFPSAGLILADGTTTGSNCVVSMVQLAGSSIGVYPLTGGTITNLTSPGAATNFQWLTPVVHMRLRWVSANTWRLELSPDGVQWTLYGFSDRAQTLTPTHMGVFVTNWGGTTEAIASFEYLRSG